MPPRAAKKEPVAVAKAPAEKKSKALVARCIKEHGNWSSLIAAHKFDNKAFDPVKFKADMPVAGPKLAALIAKIQEIDAADYKKYGHYFKHFIYSDIKSGYGAKLIASALAASGFKHGYGLSGSSFKLGALPPGTPHTFATLTSVSFFERPIGIRFRRELLGRYNARPDNVHGENLRIIILDSGFREGVDLFDVKYAHLFEPIATAADQKQAIGRVTRFCGQKGLRFHPTEGWPVQVYRYETTLTRDMRSRIMDADATLLTRDQNTFFDLFLKFSNIDPRKITFARELEAAAVDAAVDKPLTAAIHGFGKAPAVAVAGGALANMPPPPPPKALSHTDLDAHVRRYFSAFAWPPAEVKNGCAEIPTSLEFSPTQNFVRKFLTTASPYNGMLAFHSVGTGKTCTAIATATTSFEPAGWTILYVTKHTLKADVWKNMFDQSCSVILQERVKAGLIIPKEHGERMRLVSKSWKAIQPLSYRQFSNMLGGKSALADVLRGINGAADPLRKTLVVIDEAHKLFAGDVVGSEKGDVDVIRAALHRSYATSGASACKVLLMTGTPYTDDPMDMIRLLNLLRPTKQQLPDTFDTFATAYLDDLGAFTAAGRARFMDDAAGIISYLNREKDVRTFAYPVISEVRVPMSEYEFVAELDEVMINRDQIQKMDKRLKEYQDSAKVSIDSVKKKSVQVIKDKEAQVKECGSVAGNKKKCKAGAKAALKAETADAKADAKAEEGACSGTKAAIAACKREIRAALKERVAAARAAAAEDAKGCDGDEGAAAACSALKKELAELKASARKDIVNGVNEVKRRYDALISTTKNGIAQRKKEGRPLDAALRAGQTADNSQQGALEDCLVGRVPPAVRELKKGKMAEDKDMGSRNSTTAPSSIDQPPIYLIAGHGNEMSVPFDERPQMPAGTTLVVFSTCFRPNYADIACNFMDIFANPAHQELLSDPYTNQDEIEALLKSPIRVYAPGERAPVLNNSLFLDFSVHKTVLLKSGVFQLPNIPVVPSVPNARDERAINHGPCMKYATIIKSPAHYGAGVHNMMYDGNIYRKAAKQQNFTKMSHRLFPVKDIMGKFGHGVYYSIGCRSPGDAGPGADMLDIYEKSEAQQNAHRAPKEVSP